MNLVVLAVLGGLECLGIEGQHLGAEIVDELVFVTEIVASEGEKVGLVSLCLRHQQVMSHLGAGDDAVWRELHETGHRVLTIG